MNNKVNLNCSSPPSDLQIKKIEDNCIILTGKDGTNALSYPDGICHFFQSDSEVQNFLIQNGIELVEIKGDEILVIANNHIDVEA